MKKRRRLGFLNTSLLPPCLGFLKKTALFEKKAFDITYLCICLLQQFLRMLFTKDPRRFRSELNMAYFLFLKFNNLRYFKDFIDDFELVIYFDFLINVNFWIFLKKFLFLFYDTDSEKKRYICYNCKRLFVKVNNF